MALTREQVEKSQERNKLPYTRELCEALLEAAKTINACFCRCEWRYSSGKPERAGQKCPRCKWLDVWEGK